ncbi:11150_t:CDS:1 [Funneliformis mosseae]|uniref:11150_t:CDS:1 n=1 Tax=Funneliformis mosseae TaxID=27381 RepID=A0A9N8UZV7_FUNMO|nr:11150_t:CDS:1 [Funneliformis mosseae]
MKKADTLIHFVINLYYHDYYYTPLMIKFSKLLNLKTLKIDVSYLEFEDQLRTSTFRNLESFQIDLIEINTVVCIIKNCGGRLRKILIDDYNFDENFYEESLILIRTIYEHCPLIEYLTLTFLSSKEHFIEFEKLLVICQNLKVLLLEISESINDVNEYELIEGKRFLSGERLLNVLVRSAPFNLREIRFFGYFKFSLIILEEFLENWRGRPALLIITSDHDHEKEAYIKIISKYKIDGVIKDYRYEMF